MSEVNVNSSDEQKPKTKKRSNLLVTSLVVVVILVVGLSLGYFSGLQTRQTAASQVLTSQLTEAFNLGVKALDEGLYQVALQHFQFVLTRDPKYPGAQDKLVQVLLALKNITTPMDTITPAVTATPDNRAAETIYQQARAAIAAKDWASAMTNLDALRKNDPTYKVVDVDDMYYITLINLGESMIANTSCDGINLEGGIYNLTLAERFGPLDNVAQGLRDWARLYITGASFWEIDWNQALYYFDQLYRNMPYLMDSSCMTSTQRYRYAAVKYADTLLASGDACGASSLYASAMQFPSNDNPLVGPTATYAWSECEKGHQGGQNGGGGHQTPTPGTETPTLPVTETPTLEPSPTSTP